MSWWNNRICHFMFDLKTWLWAVCTFVTDLHTLLFSSTRPSPPRALYWPHFISLLIWLSLDVGTTLTWEYQHKNTAAIPSHSALHPILCRLWLSIQFIEIYSQHPPASWLFVGQKPWSLWVYMGISRWDSVVVENFAGRSTNFGNYLLCLLSLQLDNRKHPATNLPNKSSSKNTSKHGWGYFHIPQFWGSHPRVSLMWPLKPKCMF